MQIESHVAGHGQGVHELRHIAPPWRIGSVAPEPVECFLPRHERGGDSSGSVRSAGGTDARLRTGHAGGVKSGQAQGDETTHQEPGDPDFHSARAADDEEDVAPLGGTAAGEDVGEAGLVQQAAHDVRVPRSIAWFAELGVEVERHRAEAPVLVAEGHHVGKVGDLGRPRLRGAEGRVVVCEHPHDLTTAAERPHHRVGVLQLGLAGEDLGGVVMAVDTAALRTRGPADGVTFRSR